MQKLNSICEIITACKKKNIENAPIPVHLDSSEVQQISSTIAEISFHQPFLAMIIASSAYNFVPHNNQSYSFLDQYGCALFNAKANADAYVLWNAASQVTPYVSEIELKEQKDIVTARMKSRQLSRNTYDFTNVAKLNETSYSFVHLRNNMKHALRWIGTDDKIADDVVKPLSSFVKVTRQSSLTSLSIPHPYHAFNPSMIPHPDHADKFLINLRAGNYSMTSENRYVFPVGHKGVDTINFLGSIDCGFVGSDIGKSAQLKVPCMPYKNDSISGLEDVRLVYDSDNKQCYITFTSLEMTPERRPSVGIATLDLQKGKVGTPLFLEGLEKGRIEKNWIPFTFNGQVYAIYDLNPIVVVKPDMKTGKCPVVSLDACMRGNSWRGSAPLVPLTKELIRMLPGAEQKSERGDLWYVTIVHISNFPKYCHKFIALRLRPSLHSTLRPFSIQIRYESPVFFFEKFDIEFTCGMAVTPDNKEFVLPYAKRDEFCCYVRFTTQSLLEKQMTAIESPDLV